ncbi:hypothetical protein SNE40_011815 [Patella caerulea]|uniref:Tartrate-resistant acid phosphatase type 5 n=1 Tax=Patella caerulea TaxID=87958 RepID=A0AAN8PM72_PATCE
MGDWGGTSNAPYTTPVELDTANQMAKISRARKPSFVLALGDNFYYNGVKNVNDPRFQETFEVVYRDVSLLIPWYVIAGNHDWRGNVSAQIAYTKLSNRWRFPYFFYPLTFKIPGTSDTIDILMIDTVLLCGHVIDDFHGYQPNVPKDGTTAEIQWAWLERQLAASKARYLFTAGHFPVYSVAEHGPTRCLVNRLLPLLSRYKANGHFAGHDHSLQHLRTTDHRVTLDFIVSGTANFIDPSTRHMHSVPQDSLKFHWADTRSKGGFCFAEAEHDKLTLTFIRADGHELYKTNIAPRNVL